MSIPNSVSGVAAAVTRRLFAFLLVGVVLVALAPAQEEPQPAGAASQEDGAAEQEPQTGEPSADDLVASSSERVRLLSRGVEADTKRLEQLGDDLVSSGKAFDVVNRQMEELQERIDELRSQLPPEPSEAEAEGEEPAEDVAEAEVEAEPAPDAEEAVAEPEEEGPSEERVAEIRAELEVLDAEYERLKRWADLLLEIGQLAGRQIQLIEVKHEEGAFLEEEYRTGIREAIARPPAEGIPAATGAEAQGRGVMVMPGVSVPVAGAQSRSPTVAPLRTETAEQIEALMEVRSAEADQAAGERSLSRFADVKEVFDQQIANEQRLLEIANEAREIAETELEGWNQRIAVLDTSAAEVTEDEARAARAGAQEVEDQLESINSMIEESTAVVEELARRSEITNAEFRRRTDELAELRERTQDARSRAFWLQSPLHPRNVWAWIVTRGPRMLLVVLATAVLLIAIRVGTRRLARTFIGRRAGRGVGTARADTLALSFSGVSSVLIVVGGVFLLLQEAGVDLKTVLGGAAVLGIAVAFGAQNLMRDYFSGFMILLEDQFELGDLVTIGTTTGRVEKVNMRTTSLRDLEGRVHFIPNGVVNSVTNWTYEYSVAVVDVTVAYREKVDPALAILLKVAEELHAEEEWKAVVLDEPVLLGVQALTESGSKLRVTMKTQAGAMIKVKREMYRRVKNAFDDAGIEMGTPHRRVEDSGGSAAD